MSAAVSYPRFHAEPVSGKPLVEGVRIRVRDIAWARDRGGYTPEEIAATICPDLSLGQVYSALAYFEDHRQAAQREQDAVDDFPRNQSHCLMDRSESQES